MRSRPYHRRTLRSTIVVGAALISVPAAAQQQDEQLWLQVNTNVPLGDGFRVTLEQIGRWGDSIGGLTQTEFGAILGYKIADNVEFGIGYRKVGAHNNARADDEDRIRQHVIATFGPVTTRFRIDERFSEQGNGIGFRIRPLIRYNHKLGGKGWGLFASHESFYFPNSTSWGQRAGYDRVRNVAGVIIPFSKSVSGDLGYLNQYRFGRGGNRAQMEHALSFQLTINLSGAPDHARADD